MIFCQLHPHATAMCPSTMHCKQIHSHHAQCFTALRWHIVSTTKASTNMQLLDSTLLQQPAVTSPIVGRSLYLTLLNTLEARAVAEHQTEVGGLSTPKLHYPRRHHAHGTNCGCLCQTCTAVWLMGQLLLLLRYLCSRLSLSTNQ